MRKQDKISLTQTQRDELQALIAKGQHKAQLIRNAHIVLKSAAGWTDDKIAQAYNVHKRTVIRVRQRFIEQGPTTNLLEALSAKPKPGAPLKFGPKEQALVIAQACTPPPQGYARWTLALLSERISLQVEEHDPPSTISRESVRRILKKTNLNLTEKSNGASPK